MDYKIEDTELDLQSILFILRKFLKDRDEATRLAAVETLSAIGKPEIVPVLAAALDNSSVQVKIRAIASLFRFSQDIRLPLFLRKLTDENPAVRAFTANSMWNIEDENAAEILFNLMLTEESFPVRLVFSAAIGKMGFSSSASQLMKILDDENADISLKYMASLALQGIWEKMMKPRHILSLPKSVTQLIFRNSENWGGTPGIKENDSPKYPDPFLFRLQESYGQYSPSFLMKQDPLGEFAKLAFLQGLAQMADYQHFPYLFSRIEELQGRDITRILGELLNDENFYVLYTAREEFKFLFISVWGTDYEKAMQGLAETGDNRIKALIKRALEEEVLIDYSMGGRSGNWEVFDYPPDFLPVTNSGIQDGKSNDKAVSLRKVIGNFRHYDKDDVVYLLASLLNDENYPVRDEVVRILEEIGTDLAWEYIKKASVDEDPAVREAAIAALAKTFTDFDSLSTYLTHPDISLRRKAFKALKNLPSEETVPVLMEALEDEDMEIAMTAVSILSSLGEVKAMEKMVKTLNRLENAEVSIPLNTLNFPKGEAVGYLLKALKRCNSTAAIYVISALKELGRKIGE